MKQENNNTPKVLLCIECLFLFTTNLRNGTFYGFYLSDVENYMAYMILLFGSFFWGCEI